MYFYIKQKLYRLTKFVKCNSLVEKSHIP